MDEKSVSKHAQFVTFGTRFHRDEPIFSYTNILQKCSSLADDDEEEPKEMEAVEPVIFP